MIIKFTQEEAEVILTLIPIWEIIKPSFVQLGVVM